MEIKDCAQVCACNRSKRLPAVEIEKKVDKAAAFAGEKLHYIIVISNFGKEPKKKLLFKDVLQKGLCFKEGSVIVNGKRRIKSNPEKGFKLPEIKCGCKVAVEFDAEIEKCADNVVNNISVVIDLEGCAPVIICSNKVCTLIKQRPCYKEIIYKPACPQDKKPCDKCDKKQEDCGCAVAALFFALIFGCVC